MSSSVHSFSLTGELLWEGTGWPNRKQVSQPTYFRAQGTTHSVVWYRELQTNHLVPINTCDIPAEVKAMCLILELSLT